MSLREAEVETQLNRQESLLRGPRPGDAPEFAGERAGEHDLGWQVVLENDEYNLTRDGRATVRRNVVRDEASYTNHLALVPVASEVLLPMQQQQFRNWRFRIAVLEMEEDEMEDNNGFPVALRLSQGALASSSTNDEELIRTSFTDSLFCAVSVDGNELSDEQGNTIESYETQNGVVSFYLGDLFEREQVEEGAQIRLTITSVEEGLSFVLNFTHRRGEANKVLLTRQQQRARSEQGGEEEEDSEEEEEEEGDDEYGDSDSNSMGSFIVDEDEEDEEYSPEPRRKKKNRRAAAAVTSSDEEEFKSGRSVSSSDDDDDEEEEEEDDEEEEEEEAFEPRRDEKKSRHFALNKTGKKKEHSPQPRRNAKKSRLKKVASDEEDEEEEAFKPRRDAKKSRLEVATCDDEEEEAFKPRRDAKKTRRMVATSDDEEEAFKPRHDANKSRHFASSKTGKKKFRVLNSSSDDEEEHSPQPSRKKTAPIVLTEDDEDSDALIVEVSRPQPAKGRPSYNFSDDDDD